jgi:hypothetical protein
VNVVVDRLSENLQNIGTKSSSEIGLPLHYLASCLARLLETARPELDSDWEVAKASLDTTSHILQSEIKRHSGINASASGSLSGWQRSRARAFIEETLHRSTGTRDTNFVTMVEVVGIHDIRLEDPCEVEEGIAAGFAHDGPAVIDAVVNRTEPAMPSSVTPEIAAGFSLYMVTAVLNGRADESRRLGLNESMALRHIFARPNQNCIDDTFTSQFKRSGKFHERRATQSHTK